MSKLNSEFNYRYQVIGETPWAKIQTLKGFLCGRKRAAELEEVSELKYQAKKAELNFLQENNGALHVILNLKSEIIEIESSQEELKKNFQDNRDEIEILERYLSELYEIVEPTRIQGYSDEQMFEVNAENEFTVMIAKELQAEIIANGRPYPATIRNAMRSPNCLKALQKSGLLPKESSELLFSNDPLKIEIL